MFIGSGQGTPPLAARLFILSAALAFLCFPPVAAWALELAVIPRGARQGEAVRIEVRGAALSDIAPLTFRGTRSSFFLFRGTPTAFVGVSLQAPAGASTLVVRFKDGRAFSAPLRILTRERVFASADIPKKFGGNTPAGERTLLSRLSRENAILASLRSTFTPSWSEAFRLPLTDSDVTDSFGRIRQSGRSFVFHKGIDLRAALGTPVYAAQSGRVVLAREFIIYGSSVVIDHGAGVMTLYMHLSKIAVATGQPVKRGQLLGFSGESGYALSPHLHFSLRVGGVSVDPLQFLSLVERQ